MQLKLIAAGLGLGLVPRSVLGRSNSYAELSVVDVKDFSLSLDIWLIHPVQLGNLKSAASVFGDAVAEGFASTVG
jgi:DNA-binding transcriptional LysR family regulator